MPKGVADRRRHSSSLEIAPPLAYTPVSDTTAWATRSAPQPAHDFSSGFVVKYWQASQRRP
jgi:hypothetical protein